LFACGAKTRQFSPVVAHCGSHKKQTAKQPLSRVFNGEAAKAG
jgi:hypothetical protein